MSINIQGYISLKTVVDTLLSQLSRLDEKYKLDKNLAIDWAVDALRQIGGSVYAPEIIPTVLEVKNNSAKLPEFLGFIEGVYLCNGGKRTYPLKYIGAYNSKYIGEQCYNQGKNSDKSYYINYPYIITNFDSGYLSLDIKMIKQDEFGIPMIPDSPFYKEAIEKFIMSQWMYEPYIMGDIDTNKYILIQKEAEEAIQKAKINEVMPDILEIRQIGNKINKRYDKFKF